MGQMDLYKPWVCGRDPNLDHTRREYAEECGCLDLDGHDTGGGEDPADERLHVEMIWLQYRDETVCLRVTGNLPVAWRWLRRRRGITTGVLRVDEVSGKADLVLRLVPGEPRATQERADQDVAFRPPPRYPGGKPGT